MTSIVIRQFGGMAPSANPKSLSDTKSVEAHNLNMRFGDFRPVPTKATVAAAAAGKTLYKFSRANTFLTSTSDVSYVRGPITNDATERTYYTGDGVPKVTDLTLAVRQLGVPAPGTAPAVTPNVTDELTPEDALAAQATTLEELTTIIRAHSPAVYVGMSDAELAAAGLYMSEVDRGWEAQYIIAGSNATGTFVPTNAAHLNLMDARFGTYASTYGGNPVMKVQLSVRGSTTVVSEATMKAALMAIPNPASGVLIDSEHADNIVKAVKEHFTNADEKRATVVERLKVITAEFHQLASSTTTLTQADNTAVSAFYARTDIVAEIDAAMTAAALEVLNAVSTFSRVEYS